jgi:signal transduction histidine kinase
LHDSALQSLELISRGVLDGEAARTEATRAATRLRRAVRGDPEAAPGGLRERLEDLVVEFAQRDLTVELVFDAECLEIRDPVATSLTGATREALTNVAKHSQVPRAVVNVTEADAIVEVTIRDHGVGFDPEAVTAGFGLPESIRARVVEFGGTAAVWSLPGRGTRVTLHVPR